MSHVSLTQLETVLKAIKETKDIEAELLRKNDALASQEQTLKAQAKALEDAKAALRNEAAALQQRVQEIHAAASPFVNTAQAGRRSRRQRKSYRAPAVYSINGVKYNRTSMHFYRFVQDVYRKVLNIDSTKFIEAAVKVKVVMDMPPISQLGRPSDGFWVNLHEGRRIFVNTHFCSEDNMRKLNYILKQMNIRLDMNPTPVIPNVVHV